MLRFATILLFLLLPVLNASAQAPPDVAALLQNKLDACNTGNPRQTLVVVTDKNVYAKNEMLWFASYIFSNPGLIKDTASVLIATWVDDVTNKVLLQKKFPIQNEFSSGNFLVPDSTLPGAHHVIFSTNLLHHNKPIGEYSLPVSVKTNLALNYTTALTLSDSLNTGDKIGVSIALIPTVYKQLMPGAKFTYRLNGQKPKRIELNKLGKGMIYIDKKGIRPGNNTLYTTTHFNAEEYAANIKLPATQKSEDTLSIRFYPEGGDLVYGLESRVVCEARAAGSPVPVSSTLLQDGNPLRPVFINADGKGDFILRPKKGSHYSLQASWKNKTDTFDLPGILNDGVVIKIPAAVVNDSIQMEVQSNMPRNISITMHNAAIVIGTPEIAIKNVSNILIPIKEMRGIYSITILDDKARPLAERLIFARYDQKNKADLFLNKERFSTRDSVHARLQITGPGNQPVPSAVTVSCVAVNRIAAGMRKDLESVYYLENELDDISLYNQQGRLMENKPLLEEMLLLKGWRRYKWQQLQNTGRDTAKIVRTEVKGRLSRFEKKVKKPEQLVLIKDGKLGLGDADAEGVFLLNERDLLVKDGRKLFIKVTGENKDDFQYQITDSLVKITADAARNRDFGFPVIKSQSEHDDLLEDMNKQETGKTLETVVVNSRNKFQAEGSNECGDYVCQYGILNCINHPYPFKKPVVGNTYPTNANGINLNVVYNGCKDGPVINTDYLIYQAREFYGMDSTLLKQDTEEMMSTIYWKPLLYTDAAGKLEFSFFTADLKGSYLITVQGITAGGGLIFGQKLLHVQ
ncbi:hypothetical protein [Niabella drilacis]|uniref:MG2 domain-containing protein n=1 Tax=Niabella drilacis (strain DSM 25811 / CCM 8410 / CCUG 62505 / LMG 26954 / E90) TaxID=1285928 RepID=A0A1G6N776_NIADE|nr:hypothetical protein [Niabella drilacis]SDC63700.1 hypothetical protein SAMN04487894_103180 [Niabella drilacis]